MHPITQQILTLLEDDSFPSMVMLDGEWGAGKTYYIKTELIPALEKKEKKTFFFSLIGLSSINDFRDKLISSVYLSEKIDNALLGKLKNGAFAILNKVAEDGGTITSILNGSTGAVKHAMLNRINDVTIILDDLERLTNKELAKEIVGECLQLTDDNNLEFIFVMNSTETSIDKAMLEKSFSDRVYFKIKVEESLHIIFKDFSYFDKYKNVIEKNIQKFEFTNLRVMKRAANRLNKIYETVSNDENIHLDKSMELIIEDVLRISYLHYCVGKSSQEIILLLDHSHHLKLQMQKCIKGENENTNDEFKKYRTKNTPSNEIVEYCCGKTHIRPSTAQLGRLPKKENPIDKLLFSRPYELEEFQFMTLLNQLEKFIFEEKRISISLWFEACEYYLYLIEQEFIESKATTFIKDFDHLCSTKNFTTSCLENRFQTLRISNPKILDTFEQQKQKYALENEKEENRNLFTQMKKSWSNINPNRYLHKSLLNKYSASEWVELINGWESKDIGEFGYFLADRCRNNPQGFNADEKETLIQLSRLIKNEINKTEYGQKRGLLKSLERSFTAQLTKLESS